MPHPLHPAIVHFPLVLAVLIPFVGSVALLLARRTAAPRRPWALVVIMAAGLALSAWVAVETGEQQEERVEAVVPESVISHHAAAAETLLWSSAALLVIALGGMASGRLGAAARGVTVAGSVVLLVMAFRVGDSGGQLVYTHGAAQAYVSSAAGGTPEVGPEGATRGDEEREGREDRAAAERR
jgi:uncharacterized membrane protein